MAGTGDNLESMIETDQFAAAAKKHMLRQEAQRVKKERKRKEREGKIDFKSDSSDESNPYDSEEKEYDRDFKA